MKKIWIAIGRVAFWASLPLLHVYLKRSRRTRVLVVAGDEILVVRGWLNDGTWSLPGGGLHRGEDPVQGVCRELKEEIGVEATAQSLRLLGTAKQNQHGLSFSYHQFYLPLATLQPLVPQRWEIVEAHFVPISSLNSHNAQTHVLDTLAAWQRLS